jgi:[FeFe] hydrogenase H-cluster maturation GTPase HydF
MLTAPKSQRLHIAIVGRTNAGKSSVLNYIAGQDVAVTSPLPGTTTDVVEKTMELLPIGPVVFLDAPGLGDETALSDKRLQRAERVFDRADVVLLVQEGEQTGAHEAAIAETAAARRIPLVRVLNKSDRFPVRPAADGISCCALDPAQRSRFLSELKQALIRVCPEDFLQPPPLVGDLVPPGGVIVLVVPIDLQAPKGRLILPQVQTIRDALDGDAGVLVVKEREFRHYLSLLGRAPDLVVCDSQVVLRVVAGTPPDVRCTTFSILQARVKGDLVRFAQGAAALDTLADGDRILIAESCSHHAIEDDIGRVKIPRWIRQYTGRQLTIESAAGHDFPADLPRYRLVVQCGGCMQNRREVLSRIERCAQAGVPITNYGICIAKTQGVLERALSPFPAALAACSAARTERRSASRSAGGRT